MLGTAGRLVIVGAADGSLEMHNGSTGGREVHGSILGTLNEMQEFIEFGRDRVFRILTKVYPLEQVNEV